MKKFSPLLTRSLLVVAFSMASVAHANAPAPLASEASAAELLSGRFAYAGGGAERARIAAAVERATEEMGFIARRVARHRLGEKTRPDPRLSIDFEGRDIEIAAGIDWRTPADGTARVLRDSSGASYSVRQRVDGRRIYQEIRDDELTIRNVFTLSEDGGKLAIRVNVVHNRIPDPIRYRLTYRRAS